MGRDGKLAGGIRAGLAKHQALFMLLLKWVIRMLVDLVKFGLANRATGMSLAVIALLFLGLAIIAAKISAPLIYTLF